MASPTTPRRARRAPGALLVLAVGALLLAVAGCSATATVEGGDAAASPTPPTSTGPTSTTAIADPGGGTAVAASARTFVGRVADSAVAVAAVVQGDRVLVYLCDGATGARIGGAVDTGGSFSTTIPGVGPLALTVAADEVSGTLAVAGVGHAVAVEPAVGSAGLFWATGTAADGVAIKAGWIVQNDGRETGGLVTSIIDGTSNTAVPLPSGAISDGTSNTLAPAGPSQALIDDRTAIIAVLVPARQPLTRVG